MMVTTNCYLAILATITHLSAASPIASHGPVTTSIPSETPIANDLAERKIKGPHFFSEEIPYPERLAPPSTVYPTFSSIWTPSLWDRAPHTMSTKYYGPTIDDRANNAAQTTAGPTHGNQPHEHASRNNMILPTWFTDIPTYTSTAVQTAVPTTVPTADMDKRQFLSVGSDWYNEYTWNYTARSTTTMATVAIGETNIVLPTSIPVVTPTEEMDIVLPTSIPVVTPTDEMDIVLPTSIPAVITTPDCVDYGHSRFRSPQELRENDEKEDNEGKEKRRYTPTIPDIVLTTPTATGTAEKENRHLTPSISNIVLTTTTSTATPTISKEKRLLIADVPSIPATVEIPNIVLTTTTPTATPTIETENRRLIPSILHVPDIPDIVLTTTTTTPTATPAIETENRRLIPSILHVPDIPDIVLTTTTTTPTATPTIETESRRLIPSVPRGPGLTDIVLTTTTPTATPTIETENKRFIPIILHGPDIPDIVLTTTTPTTTPTIETEKRRLIPSILHVPDIPDIVLTTTTPTATQTI